MPKTIKVLFTSNNDMLHLRFFLSLLSFIRSTRRWLRSSLQPLSFNLPFDFDCTRNFSFYFLLDFFFVNIPFIVSFCFADDDNVEDTKKWHEAAGKCLSQSSVANKKMVVSVLDGRREREKKVVTKIRIIKCEMCRLMSYLIYVQHTQ